MPSVHHHRNNNIHHQQLHFNHMQVSKQQHPPHLEHHIGLNHTPNHSLKHSANLNHSPNLILNTNNNINSTNSSSSETQHQQNNSNNSNLINSLNNNNHPASPSSSSSSSSSVPPSSSCLSLPISFSCSSCKSATGTAAAAISLLSPQLLRFGDIPVSSILRCNSNHQSHEAAPANGNADAEDATENNTTNNNCNLMAENCRLSNSSNNNNSNNHSCRPDGSPSHCHCGVAARAMGYGSGGAGGADACEDDDEIWPADSSWPALDVYSSDDFRMFEFKVRKCVRGRSHDWTECPFSHPGEKARRRDPRRYHYSGTACPDFRKGNCRRGDACEYAHGVFECWLHPARYRTQPCKDGRNCRRRVCFFAHTPEQLRVVPADDSSPPTTPRGGGISGQGAAAASAAAGSAAASARASLLKAAALSGGAYDGSPLRRALAGSPALELFLEDAARSPTSVQNNSCTSNPSPTSYHPNCPNCNWIGSSPSSTLIPVGTSPSPQSSPVLSPSSASLCSAASWPTIPAHRRHLDRLRSLPTVTIPNYDEPCMSPSPQASSPNKMAEIINTLHNLQLASNASNMHSCREVRSSMDAWPNLLSQLQNFHSQSAPTTPQSRYCYGISSNLGYEGARSATSDAYNTHKLTTTSRTTSSPPFGQHSGVAVVESMAAANGDNDTPDLAWVNELVQ